jgi:hypothetical protein
VGQHYKEDPAFGRWVYEQRRNKLNLPLEKRTKLDELEFDFDFDWETGEAEGRERSWNEHFESLQLYKLRYRDCLLTRCPIRKRFINEAN